MKNESKNSDQTGNGKYKDAATAAKASAHSLKSAVTHELQDFLADIEDLVKQSASLSGDELTLAKEKINQYIEVAKDSVGELSSDIKKQAKHSAKATNDYVHTQPWQAIGAGAAAGLVLGFLLARR